MVAKALVAENGRMRRGLLLLASAALAGLTLPPAPAAMRDATVSVKVGRSAYGPMLFDGRGFALYVFTRDGGGPSRCYGACAKAWPPYLVTGALRAGPGAKRSLLGTVRRRGGRPQLTYAGRPLYHYVGERKPRQVLCQNVREYGGLWLVVRASGRLVR
jgi:predicted lipoprotein with Yx(FWY)xxD motif